MQLPALSFASAGFRTFALVDACGGLSLRTEEAAFRRISQGGGVTSSVLTLAGEIAGDFGSEQAKKAVQILFDMASP